MMAAADFLRRFDPGEFSPTHKRLIREAPVPAALRNVLLGGVIRFNHFRGSLRERVEVRSSDIVVVSFPKCGRTWLRLLLARVIADALDASDADPFRIAALARMADLPRITFAHEDTPQWKSPNELERDKSTLRGKRVLLLVRDPRDVVVSFYFHLTRRDLEYDGDLGTFIRERKGSLATVLEYYKIWAANADAIPRFEVVRYEDLHASPLDVLGKVCRFVGLTGVSRATLEEAVAFASFQNMAKMERERRFADRALRSGDLADRDSFKTRRGKVGGWRDYVAPQDAARITDFVERELGGLFGYPLP